MTRTYLVGEVDPRIEQMVKDTEAALYEGLKVIKPGARIGDIGHAISSYAHAHGLSVVEELVGHGIGTHLHEEPQIPNFKPKGRGLRLAAGMTLAIEPMVNAGGYAVRWLDDRWTVVTADGSLSAHYENTVLVTPEGCEILTLLK